MSMLTKKEIREKVIIELKKEENKDFVFELAVQGLLQLIGKQEISFDYYDTGITIPEQVKYFEKDERYQTFEEWVKQIEIKKRTYDLLPKVSKSVLLNPIMEILKITYNSLIKKEEIQIIEEDDE